MLLLLKSHEVILSKDNFEAVLGAMPLPVASKHKFYPIMRSLWE